jgi:hypothetical protein
MRLEAKGRPLRRVAVGVQYLDRILIYGSLFATQADRSASVSLHLAESPLVGVNSS